MHQHKVLSARPKIEKGKNYIEPSFTLYLVLTVGPGIESTQLQVEHGLEWQDLERLDRHLKQLFKSLLWKSKCCLKNSQEEYSGFVQASQDEDFKKSRNQPGNQPQATRDPQTFIDWIHVKDRGQTRSVKRNILMYKPVLKDQIFSSKFRLKTSNSQI